MKTQSKKGRFYLGTVITFLLVLNISFSAVAQSTVDSDSSNKHLLVKYLGIEDDMMLINVLYSNPDETKFNLSIYNSEGDILFRDNYTGKFFDRKFRVPKEHGKLNFVFAGGDDKISRSFEVYTPSKPSSNVVANNIK